MPLEIDILGAAVRLPGASDLASLRTLLAEGRCAVSDRQDRWAATRYWHPRQGERGKTYTAAAGLLDDPYRFDAALFGVSPREAEQMDPQQRILLETALAAAEHAEIRLDRLAAERVGVYVGAGSLDQAYAGVLNPSVGDAHFMTGSTLSIASNRLSYAFGLKGPSMTVDTACSSSLHALHQAAHAIDAGQIDIALVGGVNFLASPFPFIGFAQARMLSPTGRCRAFSAEADGYVRAEGAVVLLLARRGVMADQPARRPMGTLVDIDLSADGRKNGISLPSVDGQRAVMARVLARAGVAPDEIAFVEAHGTGTQVGDPVEAAAIGAEIGVKRAAPLPIGSIKSNIGHLEPASGLAGVVKALIALEDGRLAPTLFAETPNPNIDFDGLGLLVAREGAALAPPPPGGRRYAGVNSFGFGGTNAHVLLARPAEAGAPAPAGEGPVSLILSAASETALAALAREAASRVETAEPGAVRRFAAASAHGRARRAHRIAVAAPSAEGAAVASALRAAIGDASDESLAVHAKDGAGAAGPVAFVFCGNGAQWPGMGRNAYVGSEAFAAAMRAVDAAFQPRAGWSIVDALFADDLETRLAQTSVAQPLLFAIQVGLTDALAERGLRPAMVIGHSVGEVAAAYAAGLIGLDEAAATIQLRSAHQEALAGLGGMAAIGLSESETRRLLAEEGLAGLDVAGVNSTRNVTVSGPEIEIEALRAAARERRIVFKALNVAYPFHSRLIDPIEDGFRAAYDVEIAARFAPMRRSAGAPSMISTVAGAPWSGALDGEYWWRNLRAPVRFAAAAEAALEAGARVFVEIGPKPVLAGALTDAAKTRGVRASVVAGLTAPRSAPAPDAEAPPANGRAPQDPTAEIFARALAAGADVDETRVYGAFDGGRSLTPATPLAGVRRNLYWSPAAAADHGAAHPLLGWPSRLASAVPPTGEEHPPENAAAAAGETPLEHLADLDLALQPFLADHKVGGRAILPATGFFEIAAAALASALGAGEDAALSLSDLHIEAPLALSDEHLTQLRTRVFPETRRLAIESRRRGAGAWSRHLSARYRVGQTAPPPDALSQDALSGRCVAPDEIYAAARRRGLDYGPSFRLCGEAVLAEDADAQALIEAPLEAARAPDGDAIGRGFSASVFRLHPALADAALHALFAALDAARGAPGHAYLPHFLGALRLTGRRGAPSRARLRLTRASAHAAAADVALFDASGALLAEMTELRLVAADLARAADPLRRVYRVAPARLDAPLAADAGAPAPSVLAPTLDRVAALAEDDAALMLETAALSRAHSQFASLTGAPRALAAAALADAGLMADDLTADGVRADGATAGSAPPPFAAIAQMLVAAEPDRAAALALIAAPRDADARAPSALLDHAFAGDPAARRRTALALELAETAAARWRVGRPRRALVLGDRLGAVSAALLERGTVDAVRLEADDADSAARLRRKLQDAPAIEIAAEAEGAERFALVVECAGAAPPRGAEHLSARLAPGGLALRVAPEPGLWSDLAVGAETPALGAAAEAARWRSLGAEVETASGGGVFALAARAGAAAADDAPASAAPEHWPARVVGDGSGFAQRFWDRCAGAAPSADGALVIAVGPDHAGARPDPTERLTALLAALAAHLKSHDDARVALVGVAAVGPNAAGADDDPSFWSLLAALRTAANEYPKARLRALSWPRADAALDDAPTRLAAAFAAPAHHESLASADGVGVWSARATDAPTPRRARRAEERATLEITRPGALESLAWRFEPRAEPGFGEIEVEIAAAGLNFRDVMWALKLLPPEALESGFTGAALGFECAGRVARVGAGVDGFAVGDAVIGFGANVIASHAMLKADAAFHAPAGLDLVAAAAAPVAFLTARYALVDQARIEAEEVALIHGAAGGVGLAALAIARARGARVVASAGSPEKRALLEALGADLVVDSRDPAFDDAVRRGLGAAPGAPAVDVAVNVLADEPMEATLGLLKPFGRFVELGKRDFYGNTQIGLRPFRANLSYFGVDVDQLLAERPALGRQALARAMAECEGSRRPPTALRRMTAGEAEDAFRLMQRSGHVGKIVIEAPRPGEALPAAATARLRFRPEGAHLVVGGAGGFGAETARFMAERGARRIWLVGRSGRLAASAEATVAALRADGADIRVAACDAADPAALEALLADMRAAAPLASVVHAAMALDDALMADLTPDRIAPTLRAKIAVADALDGLTRGDALDHFILFSSATTLFGNPGQANYVAANGYLEGLARRRRRAGLPALAPAWGAIGDVGVLARERETKAALGARLGGVSMTAEDALAALEAYAAVDGGGPDDAAPIIGAFDWAQALRALPLLGAPLFERLAAIHGARRGDADAREIWRRLAALPEAEAVAEAAALLRGEIAVVLRIAAADLALDRPLAELGLDSLMAMELRASVQGRLDVEIPLSALSEQATIQSLARRLVADALGGAPGGEDAAAVAADAEIERSLAERHLGADAEQAIAFVRDAQRGAASAPEKDVA